MGLFDKMRRKKRKEEPIRKTAVFPDSIEKAQQEVLVQKPAGIAGVTDCCEQLLEVEKQLDDLKQEYQAVTSYLTDIQKIDRMPQKNREILETAARNIVTYAKERDKYKDKDSKLTNEQRSMIEKQEKILARELKAMKDNEAYNGIVKSDLHHLEGEKGALLYEREEIFDKQNFLKKTSVFMSALVVSLFALIAALAAAFDKDLTMAFLLTTLMAAAAATYIFLEQYKNRRSLSLIERKLQKAIGLLNKVKIKYINNRSLLEYSYEKYDVNSSTELDYLWKQYLLERENEKKYRFNADRLNQAKISLIEELQKAGLFDAEVWSHQAEALIDRREMVEVRHRLNVRRQKLRDNLDYNTRLYGKNKEEIREFMRENKQLEQEVRDILQNYRLKL